MGHVHAELMKLYAEDAAETDKPWERWQVQPPGDAHYWSAAQSHPSWSEVHKYRRKPQPELIQGLTMEQWEFIRANELDCEFSNYHNFAQFTIDTLSKIEVGHFFDASGRLFGHCRPRRTKGVKQPWFGGECPVDKSAEVFVYWSNGVVEIVKAGLAYWNGPDRFGARIIAFIEL